MSHRRCLDCSKCVLRQDAKCPAEHFLKLHTSKHFDIESDEKTVLQGSKTYAKQRGYEIT
ncbi:hypothetical protein ACTXT7_000872 [Hymenolepis weldensis]